MKQLTRVGFMGRTQAFSAEDGSVPKQVFANLALRALVKVSNDCHLHQCRRRYAMLGGSGIQADRDGFGNRNAKSNERA